MITRSMARNFPKKRFHGEPYLTNKRQKKEDIPDDSYSVCMIFMLLLLTVINAAMIMVAYQLKFELEYESFNITTL